MYLSYKNISDILNIDINLYKKYEDGKRKIPHEIMIKLANYYNTSVDYIIELTNEIKPYPKTKETK